MPWSIDLVSLDGTTVVNAATAFASVRCTWAAGEGVGAAEITLKGSHVDDGRWAYGRRRVVVKDGSGVAVFAGWLDRLDRGGRPGETRGGITAPQGKAWRASARGLAAALDQAVVHGDMQKVDVAADVIAWDLVQHAQAQSGNVWGFTLGTTTGTSLARTRYYCDGDVIGDAIRELVETTGDDWDITPDGELDYWVGGRGSDLSATHTVAPEDCIDWQCTGDAQGIATVVTGIGDRDNDAPCGPPLVIDVDSAAMTTYGRREVVIDTESQDEFEVNEKTSEELRARLASGLSLRTAWIEGRGPWAFGDVWIGDVVNAELGGAFGGDADVRCISVSVTAESLYEFIEMEWEAA